ncbi:MAG: sirohydrochlorin chelatase, partial [Chloroflexota bacterium]
MNSNQPTILLIGHGSRDAAAIAEYHEFAAELQTHSGLNVQACFLEFADPSIAESLRVLVENEDVTDIVALPLFLGPAGHQKNDVPTTINWAKKQYPHVTFRYGAPIGAHYGIVRTLADRADAALAAADPSITNEDTALLVVGRGSRDPDSNSEVVKASRMLWEGRTYGWVETCFYALTDPNIAEGIERCHRLGAKRVVIVPYLLFTGRILQRTHEHVDAVRENYSEMEIIFSEHLGANQKTLAAELQRYEEALSTAEDGLAQI